MVPVPRDLSLSTAEGRLKALEAAYEVARDKGDAASMVKAVSEAHRILDAGSADGSALRDTVAAFTERDNGE